MLARHVASGRLRFTTDAAEAMAFADVVFIGVGTPQKAGEYAADVSHVDAVIETIGPLIDRPTVILGKSTVPVGTASALIARLRALAPDPEHVELGLEPRVSSRGPRRRGHPRRPTGSSSASIARDPGRVEEVARRVYAAILERERPFLVTDLATAELVKVAANAFLATKISFINAMADVCDATGADVTVLADAIGLDERIGRKFLNAGLGFGGGCLPKDIRAFRARAGELGVEQSLAFLREVDDLNVRRRARVVDMAREAVGGTLKGATIAVLGAAFKPESDDIRDSPALDVAGSLHLAGGDVSGSTTLRRTPPPPPCGRRSSTRRVPKWP